MRYKATVNGNVPLTDEEEAELDEVQNEYNSLSNKRIRLKKAVEARRLVAEFSEISVGNTSITTDSYAQLKIVGALNFSGRNPERRITWKTKTGFVELTKEDIENIADIVGEYVTKCYEAEKRHYDEIDNLSSEDVESYDIERFWP